MAAEQPTAEQVRDAIEAVLADDRVAYERHALAPSPFLQSLALVVAAAEEYAEVFDEARDLRELVQWLNERNEGLYQQCEAALENDRRYRALRQHCLWVAKPPTGYLHVRIDPGLPLDQMNEAFHAPRDLDALADELVRRLDEAKEAADGSRQ